MGTPHGMNGDHERSIAQAVARGDAKPGERARRMIATGRRVRWLRWWSFFSAAVWTVPRSIAVENWDRFWYLGMFWIGIGVSTVSVGMLLALDDQIRKRVQHHGTFIHVSALPENDRDLPRFRDALAGRGRDPGVDLSEVITVHEAVGTYRSESGLDQTFHRLRDNLRHALRADDVGVPTNLTPNMLWPVAIGIGHTLAELAGDDTNPGERVRLWYLRPEGSLRDWPDLNWYAGEITDVIDLPDLAERWQRPPLHEQLSELGETLGVAERNELRQSEQRTTAVVLGISSEIPRGTSSSSFERRMAGIEHHLTISPADGGRLRPEQFGSAAVYAAGSILRAMESGRGDVLVFGAMPKQVAVALGYLLATWSGEDMEWLHRCRFQHFQVDVEKFDEVRVAPTGSYPERAKANEAGAVVGDMLLAGTTRLVNLTPYELNLYEGGRVVLTLPADGRVARVTDVEGTQPELDVGSHIPLATVTAGAIENLPEPCDGTAYVVSRATAAACTGRDDVLFPYPEHRQEDRIVGSRGLARHR